MDNLTVLEQKTFNNMSSVLSPTIKLGDKLQDIINNMAKLDTPVNAVAATKTLTFTGVARHSELLQIGNTTFEILASTSQEVQEPGFIPVDVEDKTTKATATLTIVAQPVPGETMMISSVPYIFVPEGTDTAEGEVSIGTDLASAQANILAAIRGTSLFSMEHPRVTISDFVANVATLTYKIGGTPTYAALSETFSNAGNIFSGANLSGGVDCSAADAITALIAVINLANISVVASSGSGTSLVLTSETAGEAANSIRVSEGFLNATLSGGNNSYLTGGVDGTPGRAGQLAVDEDYLYVCLDNNTISDANWRRISVGNVY